MAIPTDIKLIVETCLISYIEQKMPPHVRDKITLSYRFRGNSVTLIENRPHFQLKDRWIESVIAQFRFDPKQKTWTLYCADRNSKWHKYQGINPSHEFDCLLQEVNEDPTGIFWG